MANSQKCCVFVGNIPYDASQEQLVQTCEEVGPVVSFRLVIDRETGKPKGYGFCEYKDEETALSAIRNLKDREINGRTLRVDFADNAKNAERNREQGRGGPGMATVTDPQKQIGGLAVHRDPSLHQPVGLQAAMAAAVAMAGALGGAQTSNISQNGYQSQPSLGNDPLTLHLAKMPKGQLTEILTELKVMATQDKEKARKLLLGCPQLLKAVFQAHLMLNLVSPQMLQMPNMRQIPGPYAQPALLDSQQPSIQTHLGLPPFPQNKMHTGLMAQSQSQAPAGHPTSLIHSQYTASPRPTHPRFQTPQASQQHVLQQSALQGMLGAGILSSLYPHQPANLSNRVETQMTISSSLNKQVRPSLPQYPGQGTSSSLGYNAPIVAPGQPSTLTRPPLQDNGFQPSSSMAPHPNLASGLHDKASIVNGHPPKLLKMEDGRGATFLPVDTASVLGSSAAVGTSGNQFSKAGASDSQKQIPELSPDVESALLQQVLSLTPEQLSSLPPEQQQQVIQLQQMLRQSS